MFSVFPVLSKMEQLVGECNAIHISAGYNAWREWCGLRKASNFDDMMDIKETRVRLKFKQMYE